MEAYLNSPSNSNLYDLLFCEIREFLQGKRKDFSNFPLFWDELTPFQEKVLHATCTIPYGRVASYKWIIKKIGYGSPRSAGQALSKNPFAILVPCHRVVGKDGHLRGFGGGLDWKRKLLTIEGREIRGNFLSLKEGDLI